MSMTIDTRNVQGVTIIDLGGRITYGEGGIILRAAVRDLIAKGHRSILINLAGVTYIDSAGIGDLVACFSSMRSLGGELKLLNITKRVHEVLHMTRLDRIFDIRTDESEALAAFR
jgi:anti-sigma B factor antagonist